MAKKTGSIPNPFGPYVGHNTVEEVEAEENNLTLNISPQNVNSRLSTNSLLCVFTNVDGISNKTVVFKDYIDKYEPHLILVTETKLLPDDQTYE